MKFCLLLFLFTLSLFGCSFTSGGVDSLPAQKTEHLPSGKKASEGPRFQKLSDSPLIYEVIQGEELFPVFLTATRDCHVRLPAHQSNNAPQSNNSISGLPRSLARQLFVGIDHLIVHEKLDAAPSNGDPLRWWLVEGSLEKTPLVLSAYSGIEDHCLIDMVFWSPYSSNAQGSPNDEEKTIRLSYFKDNRKVLERLLLSNWKFS